MTALSFAACATEEVSVESSELSATARYTVVFRGATLPSNAVAKVTKAGGTVARSLPNVGVLVATGTESFANKLAADASVLAVGREHVTRLAPDQRKPVDAGTPTPADEFSFLQWDMRRIGAPALWNQTIPASTVAVLDTGVMDDHPDLAGQVVVSKSTSICPNSLGPTGAAGYPNYDRVIDFDTGELCVPVATMYQFHGTHVSGTIAAKLDGVGVIGVSPTTKIAAYKVFDRIRFHDGPFLVDDVGAFDSSIFSAIVDATLSGYKVINMSLGGGLDRSTRDGNAAYLAWDRVAKWANTNGMLIVAAAGNDTTNNNGSVAFIPSDLATVMSVSATGSSQLQFTEDGFTAAPGSDVLAFYSNFGAAVDIAAPGGDCGPSLFTTGECDPVHLIPSTCIHPETGAPEWCWAAGTSMAAPHVAAVAAVVRAKYPALSSGGTRSRLKDTAQNIGGRQGFGAGLVDANAATR